MSQFVVKTQRGVGPTIRGIAAVSVDPFSPRYDLNRDTGVITRNGHSLNGLSIKGRILLFPSAKGGVAAGWAYFDLRTRNLAPLAFIFQTVNSVMVQGAVMAGIPILDGISVDDYQKIKTGDELEVDGSHGIIRVFRK
jgi:hypothetical protein